MVDIQLRNKEEEYIGYIEVEELKIEKEEEGFILKVEDTYNIVDIYFKSFHPSIKDIIIGGVDKIKIYDTYEVELLKDYDILLIGDILTLRSNKVEEHKYIEEEELIEVII